jgi:catechol 2,3-dioxygenase-like lactoylglutathione lyase family enzyme
MKITRINHMAYNVAGKVAATREFYTKLLGLPEVAIAFPGREPVIGSNDGLWTELGGVQMHLIGAPLKGEPREPQNTHVSWYVADLEEAVAEIRAAGHEIREMTIGGLRIVWVSDPGGNTVELQQDPECASA